MKMNTKLEDNIENDKTLLVLKSTYPSKTRKPMHLLMNLENFGSGV